MASAKRSDQNLPEVIGIFGGSFDPPHVAHTLVAAYVLAAFPIDRLLIIPTFRHAFAKPLAPYDHRVCMCELAMSDIKRVEVSRIEEEIGGDSLTLKTITELGQRHPEAAFRLVIGSDLLRETDRWFRFERICQLAPPIVVARTGYRDATVSGPELPLVSSSEIRHKIADGLSTDGFLARAVANYISVHGLYRDRGM
jgi:nicotinate-nucleotide adenylyltransferase